MQAVELVKEFDHPNIVIHLESYRIRIVGLDLLRPIMSLPCHPQAVELVKEVDHPNIVIHLDSYHMNIEEGSLSAAVEACGDLLGYVHIGESHRGYLGSGKLFKAP